MDKIVITGASGHLGKTLLQSLSDSNEILAVSRKKDPHFGSVEWKNYEALTPQDLHCDALVHAAAIHPRSQPHAKASDYIDANIDLFKKILKLAAEGGTKRFVFLSTHYLNQKNVPDWNEKNLYPVTKYLGESLLNEMSDSFPLSINLRLPGILTPHMPPGAFLVDVVNKMRLNEEINVTHEDQVFELADGVMVAEWLTSLLKGKNIKGHFTSTLFSQPVWKLEDIVQNFRGAMKDEDLEPPTQTQSPPFDSLHQKMEYLPPRTEDVIVRFIREFKESL